MQQLNREEFLKAAARIVWTANHEWRAIAEEAWKDPGFLQETFDEAPEAVRKSTIEGVAFILAQTEQHLSLRPNDIHRRWVLGRLEDGWKHGPAIDYEKKEHPGLVAFVELPWEVKMKDYLFLYTVRGLCEGWLAWGKPD